MLKEEKGEEESKESSDVAASPLEEEELETTLYCSASSPHCSSSSHPQVPGHLFVGHRLWLDRDPQVRHQALPLLGSLNPGEALLPHQPREEVEDLHLSRYSGPEAGSVDELD